MHGILRQLVEASVNGHKPDAVNLSFMIAMFTRHAIAERKQIRVLLGEARKLLQTMK
jgi:hypothetical protein